MALHALHCFVFLAGYEAGSRRPDGPAPNLRKHNLSSGRSTPEGQHIFNREKMKDTNELTSTFPGPF